MKTISKTLSPNVVDVLQRARCEGPRLFLAGQLPRALYDDVAQAIELLGGQWKRGKPGFHLFPEDCEQAIALAVMTGQITDFKKTFQIFETPDNVADTMVELAVITPAHSVLEPSAGRGQILRAIERAMVKGGWRRRPIICFCEMHEPNALALETEFGKRPTCRDFMSLPNHVLFDRIVMNPPFRNGQDIEHVQKAYGHLRPGGIMVALTYPGWGYRMEAKYASFRAWMGTINQSQHPIPAGAFSKSGTEIRTTLLVITK